MYNGAKLAVASVARATPLFLPRPEIIYINVLHYSAPPRTYLLCATPPLCPDWRHWLCSIIRMIIYNLAKSYVRLLTISNLLTQFNWHLGPINENMGQK